MTTETITLIKSSIKTIPDYPKPGILFRDVTSLMENATAYKAAIQVLVEKYQDMGFTKVVGTEARGFLFGAPLALELGIGFVPVRKRVSCRVKRSPNLTNLNTALIRLKFILMRYPKGIRFWLSTTCLPQVEQLRRPLNLFASSVERLNTLRLLSICQKSVEMYVSRNLASRSTVFVSLMATNWIQS